MSPTLKCEAWCLCPLPLTPAQSSSHAQQPKVLLTDQTEDCIWMFFPLQLYSINLATHGWKTGSKSTEPGQVHAAVLRKTTPANYTTSWTGPVVQSMKQTTVFPCALIYEQYENASKVMWLAGYFNGSVITEKVVKPESPTDRKSTWAKLHVLIHQGQFLTTDLRIRHNIRERFLKYIWEATVKVM